MPSIGNSMSPVGQPSYSLLPQHQQDNLQVLPRTQRLDKSNWMNFPAASVSLQLVGTIGMAVFANNPQGKIALSNFGMILTGLGLLDGAYKLGEGLRHNDSDAQGFGAMLILVNLIQTGTWAGNAYIASHES